MSSNAHDPSDRSFVVMADAGLANRLNVLLSGLAVAESTSRRFAMRWRPSAACGCSFDRLFQNPWPVGPDIEVDPRQTWDLTVMRWHALPDWHAMDDPVIYVYHWGLVIRPSIHPHHAALLARAEALACELTPVPHLLRRVDAFQARHFHDRMIGVHLRRGDLARDRPDTAANFVDATRQVDVWLDANPDAGLLLCTDDGAGDPYSGRPLPRENVAEAFRQRYGERVVMTEPRSLDRRSPESIEDALVDLWLLRRVQFLVGTKGSSFTDFAGFGRSIPRYASRGRSPEYEQKVAWLKRFGLDRPLSRWVRYEFGAELPYSNLRHRYRRRLRKLIKGGF